MVSGAPWDLPLGVTIDVFCPNVQKSANGREKDHLEEQKDQYK